MQGLLHVHSRFSDGELTPAEIRETLRAEGLRFACLTDHAELLTAGSLEAYVGSCRDCSDASFVLVPGLEFACDGGLHILGFGCVTFASSTAPETVVRHIQASGGLAVVAHPRPGQEAVIAHLAPELDGIEAWNTKSDGRSGPRPDTLALVERLCSGDGRPHAFYGVDWHWRHQFRHLTTRIDSPDASAPAILAALKTGRFAGVHRKTILPASGEVPAEWRKRVERRHRWESRVRGALTSGRRWLRRLGVRIPAGLKSQLRRWQ